jgi:hypothetical protein
MGKLVDEKGKRFGRLVVLERAAPLPSTHQACWECQCDCGQTVIVPGGALRSGNTRSCGCLHAEQAAENGRAVALASGEAALRSLYAQYGRNARQRQIEFALTLDQFRRLTEKSCFYCGSEPSATHSGATYNGAYVYNGVDRLDNGKGYILANCVPCCRFCNLAKGGNTLDEFLAYLDRVARFRGARR